MTHITTLDSSIYSYLDIFTGDVSGVPAIPVASDFASLYDGGSGSTVRLPSVREFPAIGNAANITNVPVYGQLQSSQVAGQSDAPTMDFTINYVATDMTAIHALEKQEVAFRFMMTNASTSVAVGAGTTIAAENTEWYWLGKIESIQVSASLTDATTAVVSVTIQGDFVGPATVAAA